MKSLTIIRTLQIVSFVLLLLCFCVIFPVWLSLDIYGLQDSEFTDELYRLYLLKFWWYEGNGFASLFLLIHGFVLPFSKFKTDDDIIRFKRKIIVNLILSLLVFGSYLLGALIIDLVNSLKIIEYWVYLIPPVLFLVIQINSYVVFHNLSKKKKLESIREDTI